MSKLYYTAPSDECFNDMKLAATRVWSGYEDPYRSEKLDRIAHIQNIGDNFMYLLAMFDQTNQAKVGALITDETRAEARARMLDGGMEEWELPF